MIKHIFKLILWLVLAVIIALGHWFYQSQKVISEQKEVLESAITGDIAESIKVIEQERASMTVDSEKIIELDEMIQKLEQEKEAIRSWYTVKYEAVTENKQIIKDTLWLN